MRRWYPLSALEAFLNESPTTADLVSAVVGCESVEQLRLCREILWATIEIKCYDGRRAWLTRENADVLYRYSQEDPGVLLSSLTAVNAELDRLGGDEWG